MLRTLRAALGNDLCDARKRRITLNNVARRIRFQFRRFTSNLPKQHHYHQEHANGGIGGAPGPVVGDASISSTETLLRNIQGLLKVAADNARQQERQINYEKGTNSNMVYLLSLAQYYMYLAATQKC